MFSEFTVSGRNPVIATVIRRLQYRAYCAAKQKQADRPYFHEMGELMEDSNAKEVAAILRTIGNAVDALEKQIAKGAKASNLGSEDDVSIDLAPLDDFDMDEFTQTVARWANEHSAKDVHVDLLVEPPEELWKGSNKDRDFGGVMEDEMERRRRERERRERRERLERRKRERQAAMESRANELLRSMGNRAFRAIMSRAARRANVSSEYRSLIASSTSPVVTFLTIAWMYVTFWEEFKDVGEAVRNAENFDRRQRELERELFRQIDRNQYEIQRIETELRTA